MKLLVRNLARTTNETSLRALFEHEGRVQSCHIVIDSESGRSKGFAFVEMPKPGEARAAIKNINGKQLDDSTLRVKKAETRAQTIKVTDSKAPPAAQSSSVPAKKDAHGRQDPLHGMTLEKILLRLQEKYGWQELGRRITIKCFTNDPGLQSSLKFLRKTPWARQKVEELYLKTDWPANKSPQMKTATKPRTEAVTKRKVVSAKKPQMKADAEPRAETITKRNVVSAKKSQMKPAARTHAEPKTKKRVAPDKKSALKANAKSPTETKAVQQHVPDKNPQTKPAARTHSAAKAKRDASARKKTWQARGDKTRKIWGE